MSLIWETAMRRSRRARWWSLPLILFVGLLGFALPAGASLGTSAGPGAVASRKWSVAYAKLPLSFEANRGQSDSEVKFLARGQGYTFFLTPNEAVLSLRDATSDPVENIIRMRLSGVATAAITGEEQLSGESNYFLGSKPELWRTHIPNYARVKYSNLYPGIDLVYYGHQGQLECDYIVSPGADLRRIGVVIEGAQRTSLSPEGELVLDLNGGDIRWQRPQAYQRVGGRQQWFPTRYVLSAGNRVGIAVTGYDRRKPLIIDPVLSYATYLGGSGGDIAYGIGVDSSGDAIVTGTTSSTNFPTKGGIGGSKTNGDAFVSKLNPTGTALVYSTYLGGTGVDTATAVAVASGDAFVTGNTTSTDFPVTAGVFQPSSGGNGDAFVAQLNSSGSALVYSSYLGGSSADFGYGIAVDSSGNAYVTGSTQSVDFPIVSPLQPGIAGASDAFVAKVNFTASALVYCTYLGGSQADVGQGIQVDGSGNAVIVGSTFSPDFPLQNPLQNSNAGSSDAFVAKLDAAGATLIFSTYLGGTGDDRGLAIALDASGNPIAAGSTNSTDFPTTPGALTTVAPGQGDGFVAKLTATGGTLTYSTFLGGGGVDQASGVAVDGSGNAFVTGFTQSGDFPTSNAVQRLLGIGGASSCGANLCADAFVTEINPSGTGLVYSTYLGGSNAEFGEAIALDSSGDPYVTGATLSSNFPIIVGSFQGTLSGSAGVAFVAKIDASDSPGLAVMPAIVDFGNQTLSVRSSLLPVTVANEGTAPLDISTIAVATTSTNTTSTTDFAETDTCIGTVAASGGTCTINLTFTPSVLGNETGTITIADNATGSPQVIQLKGAGVTAATDVTLSTSSLSFGSLAVGSVSDPQSVTITNTGSSVLTISAVSAGGDYTQTNTCGATNNILNPGQSCTVSVSFAPTGSGARNGQLSISDNATGSPQRVSLTGTGTAIFSLGATGTTTTVLIGTATATFTISATAINGFTGSIALACPAAATCAFSPASILAGQNSTLTVSNLTASTTNPFNFSISGTSGSQQATLLLTILFADFSMSATPSLQTVASGDHAAYTVLVTPANGFNQAVGLSCSNLPPGGTCSFVSASVTPNGSPASVALTINTVKRIASAPPRWAPPAPRQWLFVLLILLTGTLASLIVQRRRALIGAHSPAGRFPVWMRVATLSFVLALGFLAGSCRSPNVTPQTLTGNYTVTITGTLNSNTAVTRTTTVNLSIT